MHLPLLIISEGRPTPWQPTTIRDLGQDEAYLERLIGLAPELLGLEDLRTHVKGPYAAFHQLSVETPGFREVNPDIVFLTESGHVVVVEVKLGDNPELRGRKVVAQVVEYAASIARYTEEELVELFEPGLEEGARFSQVVRKHFPKCPRPIELAEELVRKIQAAELHLVVACDQAPEGLRELVEAVTAQRALGEFELRICELVPYVRPGGGLDGMVLVPSRTLHTEVVARTVVEVTSGLGTKPMVSAKVTPQAEVQANLAAVAGKVPRVPHPEILAAEKAYAQMMEPGTRLTGRAPAYRFVVVDDWPAGGAHYEFLHRKTRGELSAELHFEDDDVVGAANAVRDAKVKATAQLPGLTWDQSWAKGRGRLRVIFKETENPEVVARAMVALIRATRAIVEKALKE